MWRREPSILECLGMFAHPESLFLSFSKERFGAALAGNVFDALPNPAGYRCMRDVDTQLVILLLIQNNLVGLDNLQ